MQNSIHILSQNQQMWTYFTVYFSGYLLQQKIAVSRFPDRMPDYGPQPFRLRPPRVSEIDFVVAASFPYVTDISAFLDEPSQLLYRRRFIVVRADVHDLAAEAFLVRHEPRG